ERANKFWPSILAVPFARNWVKEVWQTREWVLGFKRGGKRCWGETEYSFGRLAKMVLEGVFGVCTIRPCGYITFGDLAKQVPKSYITLCKTRPYVYKLQDLAAMALVDSLLELIAYTDSDYAGATQDRKSTTGGCQFLGNRLISWQCKKQTVVATSTTEAEYVAAANCCGQITSILQVAYTNSDYAGATQDRKSTTGGCQFLGNRLISWQCKKQTVVATSTTEAEYVAAASCCGQVLWIQNQLLDYGYNFMNTVIYIDNTSTICIIENPVQHSKTKHIEIRHHFIRDCNAKKLIQMAKIDTQHNVADLLTKGFDAGRFQYLVSSIGMLNP
ncbi:hypothetical protein Tco_0438255, partial [Tanacetum coccineum]